MKTNLKIIFKASLITLATVVLSSNNVCASKKRNTEENTNFKVRITELIRVPGVYKPDKPFEQKLFNIDLTTGIGKIVSDELGVNIIHKYMEWPKSTTFRSSQNLDIPILYCKYHKAFQHPEKDIETAQWLDNITKLIVLAFDPADSIEFINKKPGQPAKKYNEVVNSFLSEINNFEKNYQDKNNKLRKNKEEFDKAFKKVTTLFNLLLIYISAHKYLNDAFSDVYDFYSIYCNKQYTEHEMEKESEVLLNQTMSDFYKITQKNYQLVINILGKNRDDMDKYFRDKWQLYFGNFFLTSYSLESKPNQIVQTDSMLVNIRKRNIEIKYEIENRLLDLKITRNSNNYKTEYINVLKEIKKSDFKIDLIRIASYYDNNSYTDAFVGQFDKNVRLFSNAILESAITSVTDFWNKFHFITKPIDPKKWDYNALIYRTATHLCSVVQLLKDCMTLKMRYKADLYAAIGWFLATCYKEKTTRFKNKFNDNGLLCSKSYWPSSNWPFHYIISSLENDLYNRENPQFYHPFQSLEPLLRIYSISNEIYGGTKDNDIMSNILINLNNKIGFFIEQLETLRNDKTLLGNVFYDVIRDNTDFIDFFIFNHRFEFDDLKQYFNATKNVITPILKSEPQNYSDLNDERKKWHVRWNPKMHILILLRQLEFLSPRPDPSLLKKISEKLHEVLKDNNVFSIHFSEHWDNVFRSKYVGHRPLYEYRALLLQQIIFECKKYSVKFIKNLPLIIKVINRCCIPVEKNKYYDLIDEAKCLVGYSCKTVLDVLRHIVMYKLSLVDKSEELGNCYEYSEFLSTQDCSYNPQKKCLKKIVDAL